MRLVWITRASPAAEETALRLRALGLEALVDPVLQVRDLGGKIGFGGMGAIAFTSRNGVDAFARANPERDLPVYAVGDATAEAARQAGFAQVESADGDGEALAALIAARHDRAKGAILTITAREPAFDLTKALGAEGLNVASISAYETVPRASDEARARLAEIDAVLVHSPKAARELTAQLPEGGAAELVAVCISNAAAAPLEGSGFREVRIAKRPTEAALLQALTGEQPAAGPIVPDEAETDDAPIRVITPAFIIALVFGLACVLGAVLIAFVLPRR